MQLNAKGNLVKTFLQGFLEKEKYVTEIIMNELDECDKYKQMYFEKHGKKIHGKTVIIPHKYHNAPKDAIVFYEEIIKAVKGCLLQPIIRAKEFLQVSLDRLESKLTKCRKMNELQYLDKLYTTTNNSKIKRQISYMYDGVDINASYFDKSAKARLGFIPGVHLRNAAWKKFLENCCVPKDTLNTELFPFDFEVSGGMTGITQFFDECYFDKLIYAGQIDINHCYFTILKGKLPTQKICTVYSTGDYYDVINKLQPEYEVAVLRVFGDGTYSWLSRYNRKSITSIDNRPWKHYVFKLESLYDGAFLDELEQSIDKCSRNAIIGRLSNYSVQGSYIWHIAGEIIKQRKQALKQQGLKPVRAHTDCLTFVLNDKYKDNPNAILDIVTPIEKEYGIKYKVEHVGNFKGYSPALYLWNEDDIYTIKGFPKERNDEEAKLLKYDNYTLEFSNDCLIPDEFISYIAETTYYKIKIIKKKQLIDVSKLTMEAELNG